MLLSLIHCFILLYIYDLSTIMDNKPPIHFYIFLFPWNYVNVFFKYQQIFYYMYNPEYILGTSKFNHTLFCQKNIYHRINFLFCCFWEYIHNYVVKHQTTRHKILGIVITNILIFDWKNIIFGANFQLFWWG